MKFKHQLVLFNIKYYLLQNKKSGIYPAFFKAQLHFLKQAQSYHLKISLFALKYFLDFYNKNRTGDLLSRQTGDMDAIRHFIAFVIYQLYESVFLFFFALIMIFTVKWSLALCMCVVLPFVLLVTLSQRKNGLPRFQKIREQFSSLNTFVQENISGTRVVKAFSKEDYEINKFNKENDGFRDAELAAAEIWTKYVPLFEFFSNMLTIILMLVGSIMVIRGSMTLGNYVTING